MTILQCNIYRALKYLEKLRFPLRTASTAWYRRKCKHYCAIVQLVVTSVQQIFQGLVALNSPQHNEVDNRLTAFDPGQPG